MFSRLSGALRRLQSMGLAVAFAMASALALSLSPVPALAHEGHDHGPPTPVVTVEAGPRIAVQSDIYELVGVLSGERLRLYLDRFDSNEPVRDAKIEVTLAGQENHQAEPQPDGTYSIGSPRLSGEESVELVFSITHPGGDDLLIGTLPLQPDSGPQAGGSQPAAGGENQGGATSSVESGVSSLVYALAGASLAVGVVLGAALRGRRRLIPASGLGLIVILATTAYAFSHEGHDHGPEPAVPLPSGDTPRRLADGSLFVPKATQHLLEVRTVVAKQETAAATTSLVGRVIADPNRGGVVQSINGGRIVPTDKGLPRVGQTVRKGDILAMVEVPLPLADRTTIAERSGEIEQQIAVAETKLKRIRSLAERGITPESQIIDAETELEGLRRRRDIVRSTRIEPEALVASADGVIAAVRVAPGQVVQAQDVAFQIVDPQGLWIEALAYSPIDPDKVTGASASTVNGTSFKIEFQGFSRTLQQQATLVQFAVPNPPATLQVGQPVTVLVQNSAAVTGIILPRGAVVRGGNGEALVWSHTEPERFEAKPVRTEPFDAARIIVRAGLSDGERVVTRGAELVNQIR